MRRISMFLLAAPFVLLAAISNQSGAAENEKAGSGMVSGTVTYLQRMALTPDATLVVQLRDVSRMDAPTPLIAETRIDSPGQVPIPFEIRYDPQAIDPRLTYSVSARILLGDKLLFISDTVVPVITQDNPTKDVEIVVVPAGAP